MLDLSKEHWHVKKDLSMFFVMLSNRIRFGCHKEKRIIYLGIPKNGTESIGGAFSRVGFTSIPMKFYEVYRNYYQFTVIRNPFERYISGYLEAAYRLKWFKKKELTEKFLINNFTKYLNALVIDNQIYNVHIRNQFHWLLDWNDRPLPINYYCLLESIDHDIEYIKRKFNFYFILEHKKRCKYPEQRQIIKQYIAKNPSVRNSIDTFYSKDWEIYNSVLRRKEKEL